MVFLKEFFRKIDFEKNQQTTKNMKNFLGGTWIHMHYVCRNLEIYIFQINPLYSDRFSQTYCNNKYGIVHFVFLKGQQVKISFE